MKHFLTLVLLTAGLSAWGQDHMAGDPSQTWKLTSCTIVGKATRLTVNGPTRMTLLYENSADDGCGSYTMGDKFVRVMLPWDWGGGQVACPIYMYGNWEEELPLTFQDREKKATFVQDCARIVAERTGDTK